MTLALDGMSGQRRASVALYPRGKDPWYLLDRMGLTASLDTGAKIKILLPLPESNPCLPVSNETLY
jgi:hypothetical protein